MRLWLYLCYLIKLIRPRLLLQAGELCILEAQEGLGLLCPPPLQRLRLGSDVIDIQMSPWRLITAGAGAPQNTWHLIVLQPSSRIHGAPAAVRTLLQCHPEGRLAIQGSADDIIIVFYTPGGYVWDAGLVAELRSRMTG